MPDAVVSSTARERSGHALNRLPYRPDIDGLRAVAVVLVVAYHFGVPGLGGGYIGVDLFFVISGFLIASIFARDPDLTLAGLFAFYGRRIQRLMPAFVAVAAITIVVASVLMLPDDYVALLKSIRESLVTRSNLFFEHETTGYFAANARELPWLHTWSLSVEWQFYFLFPLVAMLLWWLPGRTARTVASWAVLLASVAVSIAMVDAMPEHAYFSAPARFFEFFVGVVAASTRVPAAVARGSTILAALSLCALLVLANRYAAATPFPGLAALSVCVPGFVLLVSGDKGSVLANRRMAAIGQRSYSIYLWHWPVVAMLAYVQHRPSAFETVAWFAAIYVAADATYRWVERPGIALRWRPRTAFAVWCLLPFACVALGTVFVRKHDGFPQRLGAEARHADANLKRFALRDADRCHDLRAGDTGPCTFGDAGASTEALLIGDSHARHFRPFVQVLADDAHVRVTGLTNSECLALEGTGLVADAPLRSACVNAVARDYALIRSGRFRYVVLAERWIGYPAAALAGLDESLAAIVDAGAVPVVFLPIAEDGTNTKDCFYRHVKIRRSYAGDCAIRSDNDYAVPSKAHVATLMAAMREKHPTLVLIDPQAVQCADGTCSTVLDGTPIYTDLHHLDAFGSTMLGRSWLVRFGNPLKGRDVVAARR